MSRSLSSTASFSHVEAPEGTVALPITPFDKIQSTSTVGLPLESNISRAINGSIVGFIEIPPTYKVKSNFVYVFII